jgi:5,5'-dehydrodivanillate O-demethylase oxygenase subunit
MQQVTNASSPLDSVRAAFEDFEHTGPDTLAGRYMRRFWHPVSRSQDLRPGWAVPIRVMSEDLTLYRGEMGAPHLVAFRCAHRGTQLSTGWVEDDCIRCRYHGWKFDGSGQCVEQPMEDADFARRVSIRSYPVYEYIGLIFAYLGEGDAPPLPSYPAFEQEGLLECGYYTRACNYANMLENDFGHGAFVHRDPRLPKGVFYPADVSVEEGPFGITARMNFPGNVQQIMLHGMPNLRYVKTPPRDEEFGWYDTIMWWVPNDDENHMTFNSNLLHLTGETAERYREARERWFAQGGKLCDPELSEEIVKGHLRLEDVEDRTDLDLVQVQDDVAQIGQGRIRDRRGERLGREDEYVVLLRRIWARELRALAEGRPLTQWGVAEGPVPTEGYRRNRPPKGLIYAQG